MNPIDWPEPARQTILLDWLNALAEAQGLRPETLRLAHADASTRRYLRVDRQGGGSRIVMDAPPQHGSMRAFVDVGAQLAACGLHVPEVLDFAEDRGLLLLSDLGEQPYLQALQQASAGEADRLMRDAIGALIRWQRGGDASRLPVYDEAFIRRELQIFVDWCVGREFSRQWNETQQAWWEKTCAALVRSMLAQPQVPMHRDFMVRNLMVCPAETGNPGILDFQDAVRGPIAYDMASLLRDAFISWDEERELDWAIRYWEQARKAGLLADHEFGEDFGAFWRALEWAGLQRHLKILGIFCRLKHRDGKPAYAEDLPRLFAYAIKVSTRYIELSPLTRLLEELQGHLTQTGFSLR